MNGYNLPSGTVLADKYIVGNKLGSGYEGEVYSITESSTGVEFAAKLFYGNRGMNLRAAKAYVRKLYALQDNPFIAKYYTHENLRLDGRNVSMFVSEYVDGLLLSDYISKIKGKRLQYFQAIHLLHAILNGLREIHKNGYYHGDLHMDNIMVKQLGLTYRLKFIDFYEQVYQTKKAKEMNDLVGAIKIFYAVIGGKRFYSKHPDRIKYICAGVKATIIKKRFKSLDQLIEYLEGNNWITLSYSKK